MYTKLYIIDGMNPTPVTHNAGLQTQPSFAEVATIALREAILYNLFNPGEQLVEQDIAQTFGVSRTPVREAIKTLAAPGGLLEFRPNRGAYVKRFSQKELLDVSFTRTCLEKGAIQEICALRELPDLSRLESLNEAILDIAAHQAPGCIEIRRLNAAFHHELVALSRNSSLIELFDIILNEIWLAWGYSQIDLERVTLTTHQHATITKALAKRDLFTALTVLDAHGAVLQEGLMGKRQEAPVSVTLSSLFADGVRRGNGSH